MSDKLTEPNITKVVEKRCVDSPDHRTVVKSEQDGWMTRVLWSDGSVSWHGRTDEVQRVKLGPQNQWVEDHS